MDTYLYLIPAFFVTAVVYASVGFAGGSTYLALMVLAGVSYQTLPALALVFNLIVVTGGLYHYVHRGLLPLKRILPFVILSAPLAYLGGNLAISKVLFLWLLGFSLAVAGLRLFWIEQASPLPQWEGVRGRVAIALPLGAPIGFLSGLVGIGGGIFLAPLLYLLRWGNAREIAAAASFFIFVNSLAGLTGQLQKVDDPFFSREFLTIGPLAIAVFVGGQIGTRLGIGTLSLKTIQRSTAVLILAVSGRIFWGLL